jgi:hypothetical protein
MFAGITKITYILLILKSSSTAASITAVKAIDPYTPVK